MRVSEQMSAPVVTITPETTHHEALRLLQERGLHHLPVVDPQGHLVGIVAERDLLLAATHYIHAAVEISEIMQRDVVTVMPDTLLNDAAALMVRYKIGGLPVVDTEQRPVGMLTETDLFRLLVGLAESIDLFSRARNT